MFPRELDGAKVLFYTPHGDYGAIKYPNGEVAASSYKENVVWNKADR